MSLVTVLRPQTRYKLGTALDINAYTDSDWAGCHKTRKSTSGTAAQALGCTVIALSRTQQTLALSSGEAELYAIGTAVLEPLHLRSFLMGTGLTKTCSIIIHTDSTAAKSMAPRFGTTRRTRHIDLRFLYLQNLIKLGTIRINKIPGAQNPADILTKYVIAEVLNRHAERLGLVLNQSALERLD